jgi:hypothetical protein
MPAPRIKRPPATDSGRRKLRIFVPACAELTIPFAELVTEPATEDRATPAFHRRFLEEEVARWRPIIQAANQYAD